MSILQWHTCGAVHIMGNASVQFQSLLRGKSELAVGMRASQLTPHVSVEMIIVLSLSGELLTTICVSKNA